MNQPNDFWKDKRVFITGGTGFIGTHLAKKLEELGATLSLFIHERQSPLSALRIYGDLQLPVGELNPFLRGYNPDVVFHLASQPLVSLAMKDELSTMETNVGGTYRVLNACKDLKIKSFVHISTDKVYGDAESISSETSMDGTKHPYNASKHASDILAQMFSNFFDVPLVVVRNANVYGAGDRHFDRIVPRTIKRVLQSQSPVIRGNGQNRRDYIHVDDLIDGYLKAAQIPFKKSGLSIVNMGGFNHSTLQVVDAVLEKMGRVDLAPKFEKQWRGEIPNQHIEDDTFWKPTTTLKDGLDKTIPWYVENYGS